MNAVRAPVRLLVALVVPLSMMWLPATGAQPIADHLKCYRVKDSQKKTKYTATLDGLAAEPGCAIKVPAIMVCVPASKTNVQPPPPGGGATGIAGAFGCYKVKCPKATLPSFHLKDQFGDRMVIPTAPKLLCAPSASPTTTTTTITTTTTTTTSPFCRNQFDCPVYMACNTTTGQCEGTCGDATHSPCAGGCCNSGTCHPGTDPTACGNSGEACAVCDAANPSGSACVLGHCGCTSQADCPAASGDTAGRACLLALIDVCQTGCNAPNVTACNGGCCSAPTYGMCQPGTTDPECGNTGGTCVDCTNSGAVCMNGSCTP